MSKTAEEIMAMPEGILKTVATLKLYRDKEDALNIKLKKLKEGRDALEAEVLMYMAANGQASLKFDDIGTVSRTTRSTIIIQEMSVLADFIANNIIKLKEGGGSPLEALSLLQQRVTQKNIEALLEQGYTTEQLGVTKMDKETLSFRKS